LPAPHKTSVVCDKHVLCELISSHTRYYLKYQKHKNNIKTTKKSENFKTLKTRWSEHRSCFSQARTELDKPEFAILVRKLIVISSLRTHSTKPT